MSSVDRAREGRSRPAGRERDGRPGLDCRRRRARRATCGAITGRGPARCDRIPGPVWAICAFALAARALVRRCIGHPSLRSGHGISVVRLLSALGDCRSEADLGTTGPAFVWRAVRPAEVRLSPSSLPSKPRRSRNALPATHRPRVVSDNIASAAAGRGQRLRRRTTRSRSVRR